MDQLAKQADEKIKEWAEGKEKLVVAIDGYTGVGKTTLLQQLERYAKKTGQFNRLIKISLFIVR